MDLSLRGRHALVCGASAGIGRAAARALAGLGAEVTALARSQDALAALLAELQSAGAPAARALATDLDDLGAAQSSIQRLLRANGPVHVLINNSGGPPSGALLEAKPDDFLAAFRRHVLASHTLVGLVLPGMRAAQYGRIVNVVSTSVREPIAGLGVSNTIRGAMAAWAKTLSKELPPGVTINNVLPGFTATERLASLKESMAKRQSTTPDAVEKAWLATVPEGRLGRPEEIAAAIAFLASPAASYIRGVSLPVDGGRLSSI
ncbi:MAG: SDR family oxidoreductase [Planctomycetota bacterium]|nr:MAG: SDR family oxidoreductase [Planctomycetota bacterium]